MWLDATNNLGLWADQTNWAAGLDAALTYNLLEGYSVSWDDPAWRLPSAGTDPVSDFNQTTSEMGHLFYIELGLDADVTDAAELNASNFNNLVADTYWSGTEYPEFPGHDYAWTFNMSDGVQHWYNGLLSFYGLAIRGGEVFQEAPVPEPSMMLLFGTGIAGLVCMQLCRKKNA